MSSGLLTAEEVHSVCVDAVFALFICPAIVDPNALGVIDTPLITYMARSNLMQVAQILQVLLEKPYHNRMENRMESNPTEV